MNNTSMPAKSVSPRDQTILQELGREFAEFAALPVNAERKILWQHLNKLDMIRPLVWIFEIPWQEFSDTAELKPQCEDAFCRSVEVDLRRKLYQWRHLQGDMVLNPYWEVPPVLHNTGFGIAEKVDMLKTGPDSVVSRHFHIQIKDEADIAKIKMPQLSLDDDEWGRRLAFLQDVLAGILPVRKVGVTATSIAPWDLLVRLTGVEEVLLDMCVRPAYVHKLMDRMTAAFLQYLEQLHELNLLALNNDNSYSGGGYQYTDELPQSDFDPDNVRPCDMWGRTMSQIFSSVSPAMHEEFALQYECRWLNRFGLSYYGCCEPLHKKIDILRKNVPNLRKISMSPWIDLNEAIENVGCDYVFSWKANPAILAENTWNPNRMRQELRQTLKSLQGMQVEIILKDISTVRYEPQRLWNWAKIAKEVIEEIS